MPPQATIGVRLKVQGQQALKQVKTLGGRINQALGKIRPIASLMGGVGGVYMLQNLTRKTMDFDKALTRLAIQGHKSAHEQSLVRQEIMAISKETGVAKEELMAMGKSVIDATGDFDFMLGTLRNTASLYQTTGSDAASLGKITGALGNQFKMTAAEADEMTRILVEQGELGSWTLEEMGTTAQKVFSSAYQAGVRTKKELRDFTAYVQVFRTGFATAEETATAYKGVVSRLGMQSAKLKGMGIRVFDEDTGKMRDVASIMVDLFAKIGTRAEDLNELMPIFGQETFGAVTAMAGAYDEATLKGMDLTEVLGKFTKAGGKASDQAEKLARYQNTAAGKFEKLKTTLDDIAVTTLMTDENMESLGIAAQGAAEGLVAAVKSIQVIAELAARAADSLGLISKGGTAEGAAAMTPEQRAATQAMYGALMKPAGAPKTEQERAFLEQYKGGSLKSKFLGADPDKMSKTLMGVAGGLAATGGLAGLAPMAAGAAVAAPKIQKWMQEKEAEKFAQTLQISDAQIDRIASAVEKGAQKGASKATISSPNPLTQPGGTQGKPVHP